MQLVPFGTEILVTSGYTVKIKSGVSQAISDDSKAIWSIPRPIILLVRTATQTASVLEFKGKDWPLQADPEIPMVGLEIRGGSEEFQGLALEVNRSP